MKGLFRRGELPPWEGWVRPLPQTHEGGKKLGPSSLLHLFAMVRRIICGLMAEVLGIVLDLLIKVWWWLIWMADDEEKLSKEFERAKAAVLREFKDGSKEENPGPRGDD